MGCWDETCAITLLPIFHGQDCVMVLFDKEMHKYCNFESTFDMRHVSAIYKESKYNDYGWIEGETKEDMQECYQERAIFFHQDAWDRVIEYQKTATMWGQPLIDRVTSNLKHFCFERLMFTGTLKEIGLERGKLDDIDFEEICERLPEEFKPPEHFMEFNLVSQFCRLIRRDLLSTMLFRGCQDGGEADDSRELVFQLERDLQDVANKRYEE